MLATADSSTVASTRSWLNVFTSRRLREIVCGRGLVGLQRVYCSDPSLKVALTAFLQGADCLLPALSSESVHSVGTSPAVAAQRCPAPESKTYSTTSTAEPILFSGG
jgi:hypothetical protein